MCYRRHIHNYTCISQAHMYIPSRIYLGSPELAPALLQLVLQPCRMLPHVLELLHLLPAHCLVCLLDVLECPLLQSPALGLCVAVEYIRYRRSDIGYRILDTRGLAVGQHRHGQTRATGQAIHTRLSPNLAQLKQSTLQISRLQVLIVCQECRVQLHLQVMDLLACCVPLVDLLQMTILLGNK